MVRLTFWKAVAITATVIVAVAVLMAAGGVVLRERLLASAKFFYVAEKTVVSSYEDGESHSSYSVRVDGYINEFFQARLFNKAVSKEEFDSFTVGEVYQRKPGEN